MGVEMKRGVIISFVICLFLAGFVSAAEYYYYFSDDATGNPIGDDARDCTDSHNPCRSLSRANSAIKALSEDDVANLYFDRGDTWDVDTTVPPSGPLGNLNVPTNGPVVNIGACGAGPKPVFRGDIQDFSTAPYNYDSNHPNNPVRWHSIFRFERPSCSIQDIEVKDCYGSAIYLIDADSFTLSNSTFYNFGSSAIWNKFEYGAEDCTVEHCTMYDGQQLYRYAKRAGWGAAINFASHAPVKNNIVRHNLVYDIYGEGINNPNGLTEYNVVGDTGSIGLNTAQHDIDALNSTVRYNLVVMSDWSTSIYDSLVGSQPVGVRVFDEQPGGNNIKADIKIYGNVIINRGNGIWFFCTDNPPKAECGNPYGSVKIYNNLVIDSRPDRRNIVVSHPEEANSAELYNNAFVRYDTNNYHTGWNTLSHPNWDVHDNLFYTKTGSLLVHNGYKDNWITDDPLLPGEPSFDWDGLSGPDYYKQISFKDHLYPPAGSPLNDIGITEEYLQSICNGLPIDLDCGGACTPDCNQDSDCGSDPCKTYTCHNPGECSAYCESQDITICQDDDNCCPSGCNDQNDNDCTSTEATLIGHWTMDSDDIVSGAVLDKSGNGNDATIHGAVQSEGHLRDGLYFDGVNDYLETDYTDHLPNWTISAWIKADENPKTDKDAGPVMKQENILISYDHRGSSFRTAAGLSVGGTWYPASFGTLTGGNWYHLAASYDGETLRSYTDGQPITQNTDPSGPADVSSHSLKIGKHAVNDFFFQGIIDEVRVYNGVLSDDEILSLYDCHPADSDCSGCIENGELFTYIDKWKLDQVTIGEVMDAIAVWKSCS